MRKLYLIFSVFLLSCVHHQSVKLPSPLLRAHAHNDYMHEHPLLDALSFGYTSVEADIHLIDDTLYVAHDKEDIRMGRTLCKLYLQPLKKIVMSNNGRIYGKEIPFLLLVDIKSDADSTYRALKRVLNEYRSMLTSYENGKIEEGAVTIIISGNRPLQIMKNENRRYTFYDGRPSDLKNNLQATLMPLISANWNDYFKWQGQGAFPENEGKRLAQLVDSVHSRHRKLRFWATDVISKNQDNFWRALIDYNIDFIGTDKLEQLKDFFDSSSRKK